MTIVNDIAYEPVTDPDDPDDYRPGSRLALVFDPGDDSGRAVRNLHFIYEVAAPGDGAPLHVHPVDEAILVEGGRMEVRVGDAVDQVGPESVAFVPRGLPHAWRSIGDVDLKSRRSTLCRCFGGVRRPLVSTGTVRFVAESRTPEMPG